MNITLTSINHYDKDKEGKELVGKNTGRPYTRCLIKCNEHGDKTLSGFGSDTTRTWNEGDTVDVEIEEKEVKGITYLNFRVVSGRGGSNAESIEELRQINFKLDAIIERLKTIGPVINPPYVSDRSGSAGTEGITTNSITGSGTGSGTYSNDYPKPEDEGINLEDTPF